MNPVEQRPNYSCFVKIMLFYFQALNLTYNEIGESGANAIIEAMADKPSLELLELDGNRKRNLHSFNACPVCMG